MTIGIYEANFDGEGLRASTSGDAFGYNTFPLAGTMSDEAQVQQRQAYEMMACGKPMNRL